MPTYLVETYLTDTAAERDGLERRAHAAARVMTKEGTDVVYEGSLHLPSDEICFFTFAAPSPSAAALVAELAGLAPLRVVEVIPSERNQP